MPNQNEGILAFSRKGFLEAVVVLTTRQSISRAQQTVQGGNVS